MGQARGDRKLDPGSRGQVHSGCCQPGTARLLAGGGTESQAAQTKSQSGGLLLVHSQASHLFSRSLSFIFCKLRIVDDTGVAELWKGLGMMWLRGQCLPLDRSSIHSNCHWVVKLSSEISEEVVLAPGHGEHSHPWLCQVTISTK